MEKIPALIKVGKRIRDLRKSKGFSQEDFAAHIDTARSFYGRVERGEVNISLLMVKRIAKALNMTVKELLPEKF